MFCQSWKGAGYFRPYPSVVNPPWKENEFAKVAANPLC